MNQRVMKFIEVIAFLALATLVTLWAWSQDGSYEPWTAVCGAIAGGLEIYRRFFNEETDEANRVPGHSTESLLTWLLDNVSQKDLSETLPQALRLAQRTGNVDFEKWVRLELYGYKGENGMSETDMVPEYRSVTGRYINAYGQTLQFQDPKMSFINVDRFRVGVRELEGYARKPGMLYLANEDLLELIRTKFGFAAVQFGFNPTAILGILDAIRGRLYDRIHVIGDKLRKP